MALSSENTEITEQHFAEAEVEAKKIIGEIPPGLFYHCPDHTFGHVVPASLEISRIEGLRDGVRLLVGIMALFHDTGFSKVYDGHEEASVGLVNEFMVNSQFPYTAEQMAEVGAGITMTKRVGSPSTMSARVLMDADLSILAHPDFLDWNNALREELKAFPSAKMSRFAQTDADWGTVQMRFFEKHKWFTKTGFDMYEEGKRRNIEDFRRKYGL